MTVQVEQVLNKLKPALKQTHETLNLTSTSKADQEKWEAALINSSKRSVRFAVTLNVGDDQLIGELEMINGSDAVILRIIQEAAPNGFLNLHSIFDYISKYDKEMGLLEKDRAWRLHPNPYQIEFTRSHRDGRLSQGFEEEKIKSPFVKAEQYMRAFSVITQQIMSVSPRKTNAEN